MVDSAAQHKAKAPAKLSCAVITVSDTRTLETDTGGSLVCELLEKNGHVVEAREIIKDEPSDMTKTVLHFVNMEAISAILMTGGTGITERDQTFETVERLLTKPLPGYGELFRMLSYQDIGPSAMLSRATGGVVQKTILLTMPGSRGAVQLAMEKLILPELPHLVQQSRS